MRIFAPQTVAMNRLNRMRAAKGIYPRPLVSATTRERIAGIMLGLSIASMILLWVK